MQSPVSRTTIFWAVFVLTGLNLLDYFDRYIVAAVNTLIKQDLGLSDKAFGFLGSAFFLVYLVAAPVFGYLGDRWGRRRFMVMGAVLWSLATSLAFWVTTYPGLVIARGLVGMGEGSFGTLAPAYLADMLPLGKRARYLGIFYATIPVGAALAYFFGGLVGAAWGWRWSFLLAGLPGLILAGLVYTLPRLAAPWTEPGERTRRVVLLIDVSGSMAPYARALLRFAHAAVIARRHIEVFALGTRLTRLTRHLATHDPDAALVHATGAVVDWSGGTRLGDTIGEFADRWGVRGMARGAVIVVLSDGWDRGDATVLGEHMARLARVAHRVVWVNPLKATPGYAPLAAGMAAALPYVDEFLEGHSVASLAELAEVIAA